MDAFKKNLKWIKLICFRRQPKGSPRPEQYKKEDGISFAEYQVNAAGQRLQTGDRSEMCANSINNNQRLAVLEMLRNSKD